MYSDTQIFTHHSPTLDEIGFHGLWLLFVVVFAQAVTVCLLIYWANFVRILFMRV